MKGPRTIAPVHALRAHRDRNGGADVNGRPDVDLTALRCAAQFGHRTTMRLLQGRGADTTIRGRIHGGTPLGWLEHHDSRE